MSLIDVAWGLTQYVVAVSYVLVVLGLVGVSFLYLCNVQRHIDWTSIFLLGPCIGVAFVGATLVFVAHHEIGVSQSVVWTLVGLVIVSGLTKFVLFIMKNGTQGSYSVRQPLIGLLSLASLASTGLSPYLFLLVKRGFPTGLGTSVTWTNNDLGAYIEMATNVAATGVKDAGLITGWNAGLQASFDHPAAHPIFAAVSRLLFREPYQIGIVLMSVVVSCLLGASLVVVRKFAGERTRPILLFSLLVVVMNPPVLSAIANFFFPQLLSLGLMVSYFALTLVLCKTDQPVRIWHYLPATLLLLATYFVSIEMVVILAPTFAFLASVEAGFRKSIRIIFRSVYCVAPIFVVLAVLERDLFRSQFEIFTKMNSSGVAGWKSNFVSLAMVFGATPNEFGGPYSAGSRLIDLFLVTVLLGGGVLLAFRRQLHIPAASGIVVLTSLLFAAVSRWGIDAYQTWKFVTTIVPVFYILLVVLIWKISTSHKPLNVFPVLIMVAGMSLVWSSQIWAETTRTSYVNEDLIQISRMDVTRQQTALNILLKPYFETMTASVMTGVPTHLASPSYFFFEGQELLYRCTLTTRDKIELVPDAGPIVAEHGDYVLIGSPSCD